MGTMDVASAQDNDRQRTFMKALLNDVRALEHMLREGMIETGVRRIGVEQEMFLIDKQFRPAPISMQVLDILKDKDFTTELGAFNLEFNLDTQVFEGSCLHAVEEDLDRHLAKARAAAQSMDHDVMLVGILPTIRKSDLGLENMTPVPRYFEINEALMRLRGGPWEFRITGTDELIVKHDSVMTEACNASFQVHFQVGDGEFARLYNNAQLITAPVLAAAVNSPVLFGKRLWRETRIALFQQSVDTRASQDYMRELSPRVSFGNSWVKSSVLEIYREDIMRFRTLLAVDVDVDPFEEIRQGVAPALKALRLHNGTVYRWNRACYGISDGKPHLRIENRVFPSGPTILDEMANAAFWFGLMGGITHKYDDITKLMDFDEARANFISAARLGLGAQFTWLDNRMIPAQHLILDELLPLAEEGLRLKKIDEKDIKRYLSVIEGRMKANQTGAGWQLRSLGNMKHRGTGSERLTALTAAMHRRQESGKPVHEWDLATLEEGGGWKQNYLRVEQYMSTDLVTVNQDEVVDLVASLMDWYRIRHVLVEDNEHRLVGIVSHRSVLRLVAQGLSSNDTRMMPVSSIMTSNPISVRPETTTWDAITTMRREKVAALPIVREGRLVGLVTERDFMEIAGMLVEEKLKEK